MGEKNTKTEIVLPVLSSTLENNLDIDKGSVVYPVLTQEHVFLRENPDFVYCLLRKDFDSEIQSYHIYGEKIPFVVLKKGVDVKKFDSRFRNERKKLGFFIENKILEYYFPEYSHSKQEKYFLNTVLKNHFASEIKSFHLVGEETPFVTLNPDISVEDFEKNLNSKIADLETKTQSSIRPERPYWVLAGMANNTIPSWNNYKAFIIHDRYRSDPT